MISSRVEVTARSSRLRGIRLDAVPHVRANRLAGQRDRLRHVGPGRLDRLRRRRDRSASLERAVELGCNFFDTAWAYGEGQQRADARPAACASTPDKRLYVATKIPPKNRKWPSRAGIHARRLLPARPHPRIHREEPGEPGRRHDRPAPVPRLGGRLGRRRRAGSARWTTSSARG